MNNNEDFFRDSHSDDYPGREAMVSRPGDSILPEDEVKLSGSEREDASKWDQFTDAQRKLIVFGVLLAVILVLALVLGIGSSCGDGCGGCGSCALCGGCGDSSSDSDVPADDRLLSGSDQNITEPAMPALPDAPQEPSVPGDTDEAVLSDADVSGGDVQEGPSDNAEYVEVPGGFSACVHHADNEAGDGSHSSGGGFLGFLFGCTGCADSCNIDVSESLTDPTDGPDRQQGVGTSSSDAVLKWETQPDDEAYLELLRSEMANVSSMFMQLGELDLAMSQYTDPQKVRDSDSFRRVSESILEWCSAAEGYDASSLQSEQAVACHQVSMQLARDLRSYVEGYPVFITGAVSGTDVIAQTDQLNAVLGDIAELYGELNPAPAQENAE